MNELTPKKGLPTVSLSGMRDLLELMRQQYEVICDRNRPVDYPRERLLVDIQRNMVAAVKLTVDYAGIMKGAVEAPFIEAGAEETPSRKDPLLSGPSTDHPWRGGSTVHKLKG